MRRGSSALPWIAAAACFAAAFVWLGSDSRISREAFAPYSVHNTGPDGLSLAYAYLGQVRQAATISRPVERALLPDDAVLFRIRPDSPVPPGLRRPKGGG